MAAWTAEQYREPTRTLTVLTTRSDYAQREADDLRRQLDYERERGRARDEAIHALQTEITLLRQRLDDHRKGTETWANRFWVLAAGLIGAVVGAAVARK